LQFNLKIMAKINVRDEQGFYRLPQGKSALISTLLPRASADKIDKLVARMSEYPAKRLTYDHLTGILTDKEAGLILAAIELGRMAWSDPTEYRALVDSPGAAYTVFSETLRGEGCEHSVVLFLDVKNRLIDKKIVSIGSWTETLVPIKEILRLALLKQCPRMIVAHNHPSGSIEPSTDDYRVTEQIGKACKAVGLNLLDHLVVGDYGYTSIRQDHSFDGTDVWGKDD
jgi:DNA repair protein RadC